MLSIKEKKYCDELMVSGNMYQAAIKAGYSETTAKKQVFMWVGKSRQASRKPHMWDYLQQKRKQLENEYDVTKGKVLQGMHRIASFDMRKLYNAFGDLLPVEEWDDDSIGAIAGFEVEEKVDYRITEVENGSGGHGKMREDLVKVVTRIKKVKINDRNPAWANIAKMLGYNAADVVKHEAGESFLDLLKKTSAK